MLQPFEMFVQCKGMAVVGAQQLKGTQPPQNRQIVHRNDRPVGGDEFTIDVVDIHHPLHSPSNPLIAMPYPRLPGSAGPLLTASHIRKPVALQLPSRRHWREGE